MMDMVERVARAIDAKQTEGHGAYALARAAIEATNASLYETALRTLQEAVAGYVHEDRRVSAEELIGLLIATVDGKELVRAMNGKESATTMQKASLMGGVSLLWTCPDCQHGHADAINSQLADGTFGYTGTVRCRQCFRVSAFPVGQTEGMAEGK